MALLSGQVAFLDDGLLDAGQLPEGDLHAHVAPGHHDAVGQGEDLVQVLDPLGVFNLGDDLDPLPAVVVQEFAELADVVRGPREGGGHEIHVLPDAEEDVTFVRLADVGHGDIQIGNIDALPVADGSAVDDPADHVRTVDPLHKHGELSVINEDPGADGHTGGEARKG